jgi:hypothetical protein
MSARLRCVEAERLSVDRPQDKHPDHGQNHKRKDDKFDLPVARHVVNVAPQFLRCCHLSLSRFLVAKACDLSPAPHPDRQWRRPVFELAQPNQAFDDQLRSIGDTVLN